MATNEETEPINWAKTLSIFLTFALGAVLIVLWILWNRYSQLNLDVSNLKEQPTVTSAKKLELNGSVISLGNDSSVDLSLLVGKEGPAGASGAKGSVGTKGTNGEAGTKGADGGVGVTTAQNGTYLTGTTLEFGTNPLLHDTTLNLNGSNITFDQNTGGSFIAQGTPGVGTDLATVTPNHNYFLLFPSTTSAYMGALDDGAAPIIARPAWWPVVPGTEWDAVNRGTLGFTLGINGLTSGMGGINIGNQNGVFGFFDVAIGTNNGVDLGTSFPNNSGNIVIGSDNVVSGQLNMVFSQQRNYPGCATIAGTENYVVGPCNTLPSTSVDDFVLGGGNTYSGSTLFDVTVGANNAVAGDHNFTFGYANSIDGSNNLALGQGVTIANGVANSVGVANGNGSITMNASRTMGFAVGGVNTMGTTDVIGFFGGKVGINTDNPTRLLHVNDTTDTPAAFTGTSGTCTVDTNAGALSCVSDQKLKTNILSISNGLDIINQLQGVTYNWKVNPDGPQVAGFIAQDVAKVLPNLVTTLPDGTLTLNKEGIMPYIVEAVKAQNGNIDATNKTLAAQGIKIDTLSEELATLTKTVDDHEARIKDLESEVQLLKQQSATNPPASQTTTP